MKKYVITAQQQFDAKKPRFNAYGGGYGAHKNLKKYDRKRAKQELRREW